MHSDTIAFVGGGNMATALLGGLVANGYAPDRFWVSDPEADKLAALKGRYGVHTTQSNPEAVGQAATVVLAVKPQRLAAVSREISAAVRVHNPLVVSIAAGVREPDIRRWLGFDAAVVRTMPNTPSIVGSGATALYANPFVSVEQRNTAESLLRAVGITLWVKEESELDIVTALSGSGPAYLFLVMELMEEAGCRLGLVRETARLLSVQTAFGAAKMALESPDEPAMLRARVTSPGGTTERAVAHLKEGGIETLFADALKRAWERSVELGLALGED